MRRSGDASVTITSSMRGAPYADDVAMLNQLYALGYRINRHGNRELMAIRRTAREDAGWGGCRRCLIRVPADPDRRGDRKR
jgi:hypothetical protein